MNILETDVVYKVLDFLERQDFFNLRLVSKGVKSKVDNILLKYVDPIINKRSGLLKWVSVGLEDIPGIQEKNNIVLVQIGLRELDKEKSGISKSLAKLKRIKRREDKKRERYEWKRMAFQDIANLIQDKHYLCRARFGDIFAEEIFTVYRHIRDDKVHKYMDMIDEISDCANEYKKYESYKRKRFEEIDKQKANTVKELRSFSRKIKRRKK